MCQQEVSIPIPPVVLEYRHIRYNDFNRMGCIPNLPLKSQTVIVMLIEDGDKRYRQIYKQFHKLTLDAKLAALTLILFIRRICTFQNPLRMRFVKQGSLSRGKDRARYCFIYTILLSFGNTQTIAFFRKKAQRFELAFS